MSIKEKENSTIISPAIEIVASGGWRVNCQEGDYDEVFGPTEESAADAACISHMQSNPGHICNVFPIAE